MIGKDDKKREFDFIELGLVDPAVIYTHVKDGGWSYGEVTKPETINYRTQKPERDGLFCEKIFGPVKDFECNCGRYKGKRYRGKVCERCGVEVTYSRVRRERMGHIKLAVPVAHIWFYKALPSRMALLLGISHADLIRVLQYESWIVIDPANSNLPKMELLKDEEYEAVINKYPDVVAKMGAEAIRDLLREIDLEELSISLKEHITNEQVADRKKKLLKRLHVVEAFRQSGAKPEWMILEAIPVIPPELRPLVPLEGGRFATSDLNDLYRLVITRNKRLKNLIEIQAPDIILKNEKRMLQDAVDALLDNSRKTKPIKNRSGRVYKSLSDNLKGKQGRFRQNLLGKRVDYSGRSVIVVGPELKIYEAGIPKIMAVELFRPYIINRLEDMGDIAGVGVFGKNKKLDHTDPKILKILEEIVKDHPILLNRAPTLHRLGIQAFKPVLVEGKAIRLHPLVCVAFNADFDGDQMAVHVPLSFEAQIEAHVLMMASHNLLSPASGKPIAAPTQDMVIGMYYLTKEREESKKEEKFHIFYRVEDVIYALDNKLVDLHEKIKFYDKKSKDLIITTPGRVIFNDILPEELDFYNKVMDKKSLSKLVEDTFWKLGRDKTVEMLDKLKEMGFRYATYSGLTFGIDDIVVPEKKYDIVRKTREEVQRINEMAKKGAITELERYQTVVDTWTETTNRVEEEMLKELKADKGGFNPIYMMSISGARGSVEQVRQLAGMRGLMTRPQKKMTGREIIETPITSNFKEGLTVLEYFISTHGARKGLIDTALKTAEAGYLTRRLVDVAQDVIITEYDCGTIMGIEISALKEGDRIIESLADRIEGRFAVDDVRDPFTREILVKAGEEITREQAKKIEERGIEKVKIRSVLTCESQTGLCQKCYGRNLATGKLVEIGEAVGIMAAQSIGEPGTQLTLRTFHVGGTAMRIAEVTDVKAREAGKVKYKNMTTVTRKIKAKNGKVIGEEIVNVSSKAKIVTENKENKKGKITYDVPYGAVIKVEDGAWVEKDQPLFSWDPYNTLIISKSSGRVKFENVIPGKTLVEVMDEQTGKKQKVIVESRDKSLTPKIYVQRRGKKDDIYVLSAGAYLLVSDKEEIEEGTILAKIPRTVSKSRDITSGLPRVTELFEARAPKYSAVLTEIDGIVEFHETSKGEVLVRVVPEDGGDYKEYKIPHGRHIIVHPGEKVSAGDRLCDGEYNPHDILRIKGNQAVQEFLLNSIQEVYRMQGVKIHDKHIAIIVRQMLRKVRIIDPGDTMYVQGDVLDKKEVIAMTQKMMKEKKQPPQSEPLLLGITRSALSTPSFISAASFQETTRVLTDAAISGKRDYLIGLKENVIVGNLIPAGTGVRKYRKIDSFIDKEKLQEEYGPKQEKEEEENN